LIISYRISMSQMTTDMLRLSSAMTGSVLICNLSPDL